MGLLNSFPRMRGFNLTPEQLARQLRASPLLCVEDAAPGLGLWRVRRSSTATTSGSTAAAVGAATGSVVAGFTHLVAPPARLAAPAALLAPPAACLASPALPLDDEPPRHIAPEALDPFEVFDALKASLAIRRSVFS